MGRRGLATIAAAAACLTFAPVATANDAPYGLNDAGGFRNVLPAGEAGTDNAVQLAQFQAGGQRPDHWDDQLPLYTGLLYASPKLTRDQIAAVLQGRHVRSQAGRRGVDRAPARRA